MKPSILLTRTVSPSALMFAALMIGATPALAASPGTDATFMQEVVRTESIETRIGQLAVEKASSADVKKLGQMLIDDYAATGQESARIANTLQVSRPVDDAIDEDSTYRALSGLSGETFDRAFIEAVIHRNRTAIANYEAQAASGSGEVAAFAEQQLPVLERHLGMARNLKTRLTLHNTP
jgi:putative membrane protein